MWVILFNKVWLCWAFFFLSCSLSLPWACLRDFRFRFWYSQTAIQFVWVDVLTPPFGCMQKSFWNAIAFWTPFFVWHGCSIHSPKRWKSHLSITVGASKKNPSIQIFSCENGMQRTFMIYVWSGTQQWFGAFHRWLLPIATITKEYHCSSQREERTRNMDIGKHIRSILCWMKRCDAYRWCCRVSNPLNNSVLCIEKSQRTRFHFALWFWLILRQNYLIWFTFVAIVTVDWLDFISTDFMCNAHPYSNRIVMETKRDGKRETTCLM